MRRCYLVCYDIRDPKRLRRVHRLMKAYGEPWQYSVFYCTLKAIDRVRLETALREMMNLKEDQALIVDLGGNEDAARESATVLGPALPEQESGMVII
ncbi:MAG: CRISPR-associated endonuclease Cas2 [Planctomycetota bacterium]|nr:MAG: CRISPR-associated endonuclease Cas2 [Planctomycetota bacterium]